MIRLLFITLIAFLVACTQQAVVDEFKCSSDSDCVLAYTGMESCAPCDYADESFQCVSLEYAEKLQQERIERHGRVLCKMCPAPQFLFRCVCNEGVCLKTAECGSDQDCYSKNFGDQYECINSKCIIPQKMAECIMDSDCATGGCSGQICGKKGEAEEIITTCEFRPEYECLKETRCGCVDGKCKWIESEAYLACVESIVKD